MYVSRGAVFVTVVHRPDSAMNLAPEQCQRLDRAAAGARWLAPFERESAGSNADVNRPNTHIPAKRRQARIRCSIVVSESAAEEGQERRPHLFLFEYYCVYMQLEEKMASPAAAPSPTAPSRTAIIAATALSCGLGGCKVPVCAEGEGEPEIVCCRREIDNSFGAVWISVACTCCCCCTLWTRFAAVVHRCFGVYYLGSPC